MKTDPLTLHIQLDPHLDTLRLPFIKEHCRPLATTAAKNSLTHLDYLAQLIQGEAALRADRAVARRIQAARFPVIKTLDSFRWDWPKKINRLEIQDLFRLQFIEDHANVILLGTVGLGKTHLATALGYAACDLGYSVRFFTAATLINQLFEAQEAQQLSRLERDLFKVQLIIIDELGFVPFSQQGAQLLFGFISQRYRRGSLLLTTNLPFTEWTQVFQDPRLLGALLDRLTHTCHILQFAAESYRFRQSRASQGRATPTDPPASA